MAILGIGDNTVEEGTKAQKAYRKINVAQLPIGRRSSGGCDRSRRIRDAEVPGLRERGCVGLLRCCGVAQLVGWVASRHSWFSEVTVLQLEVQRPRPSRTAPRFPGWSQLPFAEGAPRETEACEPPGLLAGAELRREGPPDLGPPQVTLGHPESRLLPPSSGPAGPPECGEGSGARWGGRSVATLS
ncbi:hypothetical protein J1605_016988 [Eschrichtius robustus]|uniref:Uncharacterized protein n=1 Tax=Eschrichtius robustus TaxID=9764 RepID=A0AB34HYB8_ESCRO|nr:hypothetical protein J1605_016988 [Eschrichtius robustus]